MLKMNVHARMQFATVQALWKVSLRYQEKKTTLKTPQKKLRDQHIWGKDTIVKDGDSIFNTLHRLYPNLRHGSTEISEMDIEEAQYWVDRITAYVSYMIRMNDNVI